MHALSTLTAVSGFCLTYSQLPSRMSGSKSSRIRRWLQCIAISSFLSLLLILPSLVKQSNQDNAHMANSSILTEERRLTAADAVQSSHPTTVSGIPLNIFTAWETSRDLPLHMREAVNEMIATNPEFTHTIYNDEMCRDFIKRHFNKEVQNAYDSLVPDAFKADLWRYAILYLKGGLYIDIKYRPANGFKLINLVDRERFVRDYRPKSFVGDYKQSDWYGGVYNGFMVVKPRSEVMKRMIDAVVENVKTKFYGNTSLDVSGPGLMYKQFPLDDIEAMELSLHVKNMVKKEGYPLKYIVQLRQQGTNISVPILESYPEYRKEQKATGSGKLHYGRLWRRKEVYRKDYSIIL